jgi:CheY-like chemotaxis protein
MRLKQVLYNLLSNAIKFSLPGSVIKVTAEATTGGRVRVTVRDGGPGISAEDLARLFVPFHQLDNARQSGGTGLGLALAKQLVELMGGTIGVQSTLGQGSSFYFELPVDAGAAEAPEGPRPTEAPLVMVVDDDPASREIIEVALQGSGYRTLAVANGEQAIVEARRLRPDLITLDVFLPTIDGWDVLRLLGSDPSTIGVPVVMVTISSDRQKAFSLGAIEHLVKPITRNDLLSALSRHGFTARLARQAVRVLVVDDDPKQLELMHSELSPRGFEVQLANGGRAGLDLARTTPTDLILLDLLMPDLSGIEVVEALKSDERTRATPIILVTAADLSSSDRARLRGDVEAVLAKGITTTEMLVGEIDRVLRL